MANPLSNEKELYEQIKNEGITIKPEIWNLIYHRLGNDITAINLLCQYYFTNKEEVPILEAKKILIYTQDIKLIINSIISITKENFPFPELSNNIPLHPIIREMFTHYIGNDVYVINLIVQDSIDPIDPHLLSSEITQKILNRTRTIKEFMERLREATYDKTSGS
jgi:hypothetical protein